MIINGILFAEIRIVLITKWTDHVHKIFVYTLSMCKDSNILIYTKKQIKPLWHCQSNIRC